MRWHRRADDIHAWWAGAPRERYWLDVTERPGRDALLAAPRGEGRLSTSWTHRLITHVNSGDLVFHYDASRHAIDAWSVAHGAVEKRDVAWPLPAGSHRGTGLSRPLPSWGIELRRSTPLDAAVPLHEIARIQWSFFPALRALEDEVGSPLYYPFEMGDRGATRPLSGYVFKLPAVFVQGFTALASAAAGVDRVLAPREGVPCRRTVPAPRPQSASG